MFESSESSDLGADDWVPTDREPPEWLDRTPPTVLADQRPARPAEATIAGPPTDLVINPSGNDPPPF